MDVVRRAPPRAAVATIPIQACGPTRDARVFMLAKPDGAQAAAFRALRDKLVSQGLPGIVAVSSPGAAEGKTTCAINFAVALGEARGEHVLLLDGHLQPSALADILGVDARTPQQPWCPPFGLSLLTRSVHVASVATRDVPARFPATSMLRALLGSFHRAGYRRIVIDLPSTPTATSTELLGLAGGVLFVARAGRTTATSLRRAVERVGEERALGVTLVDVAG